jgi:phage repressor protein C with HTH and peptisase S24 domain
MEQYERLKEARIGAGFRTGTDAAKAAGVPVATYNAHENGNRSLTVRSSELYSKTFNVRGSWLLTGELPKHYRAVDDPDEPEEETLSEHQWGKFIPGRRFRGNAENDVPELDPFASGDLAAGEREVVAVWSLPTDYVTNTLSVAPGYLFLLKISDSASAPLKPGDRALVDASGTEFREDGLYALLDDQERIFIREITRVLFGGAPDEQVAVTAHKTGTFYYARFNELHVAGRVVGKIGTV